ncbi:hypothetical protein NDU88_003999 [Pleurodeles waltl]|uniref:Uncharacterized protein n=1 Tax=Pleurodeles waltl TaxID=8319 RepID=A0AAV7TSW2_PLEWA|nr:hypothetical protein NDU88_003999 [Pleurodeles waltl]
MAPLAVSVLHVQPLLPCEGRAGFGDLSRDALIRQRSPAVASGVDAAGSVGRVHGLDPRRNTGLARNSCRFETGGYCGSRHPGRPVPGSIYGHGDNIECLGRTSSTETSIVFVDVLITRMIDRAIVEDQELSCHVKQHEVIKFEEQ